MPDNAYITVAAWPKSFTDSDILQAIVAATGMDPADAAALQLRSQQAPIILGLMETPLAKDAVRVLRSRKVPAITVRTADLAQLQKPYLVKRMVRPEGLPEPMYMLEPWRERADEPRGLRMAEVVLLVRGRVSKFERNTSVEVHYEHSGYGDFQVPVSTSVTELRGGFMEVLDLYAMEGPPVRITGKFDFKSLLGKHRGYTENENMDKLCLRLTEEAPAAQLDLNFGLWRPPLSARGAGGAEALKRDDAGPFELYSALVATIDRAIRRAAQGR